MNHIFSFIFFCFHLYSIDFIGEKIIFNNTVNIEGSLFSQAPLVIENATIFQTITLNGNIVITTCSIGNAEEQTYLFIYGLKENLTPTFFLMIDPLTGNLYKKQLTTNKSILGDTNIFKTVLTNSISSNNNDVLKIENVNFNNQKINILFNANNLIINANTISFNNISDSSRTIHLENDTTVINATNCTSLSGSTISADTINTMLPVDWNIVNTLNINSLTAKEISCTSKQVKIDSVNKTNSFSINSLPISKIQAPYLTLSNNVMSTTEPNVADGKNITVSLNEQYGTNFNLDCNNWLFTKGLTTLKFKSKKVTLDEMNLGKNFNSFTISNYTSSQTLQDLTNFFVTATKLLSLSENSSLSVTNLTTKNILNFENTMKIISTTTFDSPGVCFSALQPLPSFTEYLVVYDYTFPIGGNVGCLSRPSIFPLNSSEHKAISSAKELKESDLLKSHEGNLFFLILLKIKNLYAEIKISKNQQEKNSQLFVKKVKKYTQLCSKQYNLCTKIKKKIKEIEKKIENIPPGDKINEILEKLIQLNFETDMDTIHEQ